MGEGRGFKEIFLQGNFPALKCSYTGGECKEISLQENLLAKKFHTWEVYKEISFQPPRKFPCAENFIRRKRGGARKFPSYHRLNQSVSLTFIHGGNNTSFAARKY